jgi:hypothetical protein
VSTTSADADDAPDSAVQAVGHRAFRLNVATFLPLLCGEMHNPGIRDVIAASGPEVVLVAGHAGLGQGLVPSLSALSNAGTRLAIHTQHLTTRANHHWMRDGVHRSRRVSWNVFDRSRASTCVVPI